MRFLSEFGPGRKHLWPLAALLALMAWVSLPVFAQGPPVPLNQRVLVVYNANVPESLDVANYYMTKRGIPDGNKCAISPSDTDYVGWSDFDSGVRIPVRNCLNAVGAENILYIVFTYQTPYGLVAANRYNYSLDQSIADIWEALSPPGPYPFPNRPQPYFADAQSQGNVYQPFVSLPEYRSQPSAPRIYSVWRLDAASAALAKGLVEKAMWAEANGLKGQGCFDRNRGDIKSLLDSDYGSGDWDLQKAADFAQQSGFQVTQDDNWEEFGTSPAPLRCDNASMYSGWYSFNNYNDAFTWNPGAIGFHLDSLSAANPRAGSNWSANALMKGITVTGGAVNEPYLEGLVHADGFYRNLFEGANVGDAALRNTAWLQWMVLNIGDPLYRPFPGGLPGFDWTANPQSSLALEAQNLIGGDSSTGTVSLARPAPAGGVQVTLASSDTSVAIVPANVIVPEGTRSATFPITTGVVTEEQGVGVFISASFSGETRTNSLVVWPLELDSIYPPPDMVGGTQAAGVVYLTGAARTGGFRVTLTSDNPAVATVPNSIIVPAGATSANFPITTNAVTELTIVTLSGNDGVVTRTDTLIVEPQ